MNENMELWNRVCVSDPDTVKPIAGKAGGVLKAIDAQSQIKRATEVWGQYGKTWGLSEMQWEFVPGPQGPIGLILRALFTYPGGKFETASDMPYDIKKDCFKKLQTDLLTKSLSRLGFNSDVFEGMFDDQRYVQERRAEKQAVDFEKEKDKRTQNFLNAVSATGASKDDVMHVLGAEGYETLEEVNNTEKRVPFIQALKNHVARKGECS